MKTLLFVCFVFSAVYILLLTNDKPSSYLFTFKICYVTCQLRHSLVLQPFLKKILDPPLSLLAISVL